MALMYRHFCSAGRLVLAAVSLTLLACSPQAEDVTFAHGSVTLSGTLILPRSASPVPAVIFVHGDGPDTREGYRFLAEQYARRGFAALTYDKRGAGRSGGQEDARFAELAGDAVAAIRMLRGRPDIDPDRIGLWGGSQGGWIAPLAASDPAARVRFVVIKAGPAVGPAALARWKSRSRVARAGYGQEVLSRVDALMDAQFEILRSGRGHSTLDRLVQSARNEPWLPLVAVMRHSTWQSSWMRYGTDIDFEPLDVIASIDAPVLWILGERDPETPLAETVDRLEALRRRGRRIDIRVFPGADHQLELPRTVASRPNYAPGYLDTMLDWCVRQSR